MKQLLLIALLMIATSSLAAAQTKKPPQTRKNTSKSTGVADKVRKTAAQDKPVALGATEEAVVSDSPTEPRPSPPPEEAAKAAVRDGVAAPDSSPKPQGKDVSTPPMFGDFPVRVPFGVTSTPTLAISRGKYKIAENESPQPQDRLFLYYNGYFGLIGAIGSQHVETLGFEKTLPGGDASVGIRLTFFQQQGGPNAEIRSSGISSPNFVLKYAPINNRETGNVLTAGLVVTLPVGDSVFKSPSGLKPSRPTLIQPAVGYVWNRGNLFLQGFSSLVLPTNHRDEATALYIDPGVGYRIDLGGSRLVSAVIPTFEFHANIPLTNRQRRPGRTQFHDVIDLKTSVWIA